MNSKQKNNKNKANARTTYAMQQLHILHMKQC